MTLLDDAKIITTANAGKAGTLYSIKPDSGTADFTITRSTTATRIDSAGLIDTVAINEPQLTYSDGSCPSFLVEPQRTNLNLYSEELDNAAWGKSDVTVTANNITSPDGTTNADKCETLSGPAQMYQAISVAANTTYTWSFYVKRGTMTDLGVKVLNLGGDPDYVPAASYYSQTSASGWTRVSFTFTTGANGGNSYFYPINASGVTGTVYLWGFQLEQYSHTTSYIPTTSAIVTRVKTVWETTGLSAIIEPLEGVLMAEIRFPYTPTNTGIISMSSSSMVNMVNIGYWGGYFGQVSMAGNPLMFAIGGQPALDTDFHKIAIKYKSGDCALWFDGVETTSSTTTSAPTGTNMNMISGTYGNSSGLWPFFGEIRQIQYYDTILTDAQLLALTS
tara:strand:- start:2329 stop:3501 length:1173 start_codon:yes stop_codon:yes gene_type:complete